MITYTGRRLTLDMTTRGCASWLLLYTIPILNSKSRFLIAPQEYHNDK